MDIDLELDELLAQRKQSHPVLTAWWQCHIEEARSSYRRLLIQAMSALRDAPSLKDPTTAGEVIALHILSQE